MTSPRTRPRGSEYRPRGIADSSIPAVRKQTMNHALETVLEGIELPPEHEWAAEEPFEDVPFRTVYAADGLCAKVPTQAQVGDFLVSFHISAGDFGLLIRGPVTEDGRYSIVGQAIFDTSAARPCYGPESCSCSFSPEMHPKEEEQLVLHFDPEDLLLFVCQSLGESRTKGLNVLDWKGYLAAEKINEAQYTQVGEVVEEVRLQPLRLKTSVVRRGDEWSLFAEMIRVDVDSEKSRERGVSC